ncbi:hypothetical protein [Candidatus Palauibacter sp.]
MTCDPRSARLAGWALAVLAPVAGQASGQQTRTFQALGPLGVEAVTPGP